MQVVVEAPAESRAQGRVSTAAPSDSDGSDAWQLHAQTVVTDADDTAPSAPERQDDEEYAEEVAVENYYRALSEHGLDFGPSSGRSRSSRRNGDRAAARLELSAGAAAAGREQRLNPILLDAGFQTLGALLAERAGAEDVFVPVGHGSLRRERRRPSGHVLPRGPARRGHGGRPRQRRHASCSTTWTACSPR